MMKMKPFNHYTGNVTVVIYTKGADGAAVY